MTNKKRHCELVVSPFFFVTASLVCSPGEAVSEIPRRFAARNDQRRRVRSDWRRNHCELVVSLAKQSLFSTSPEAQKETPKQSWRPRSLLPLFSTHRLNTGTGDFGVAPNTKENPQSLSFVLLPDPGAYSSPKVFHQALNQNQALPSQTRRSIASLWGIPSAKLLGYRKKAWRWCR